ncbi:magnesium transporter [Anoxybacillus vitaminiphilus]|uniref:Magnesium transport protein CorA n=1 Tax=Paranoxybacillus vitaminiphilus TaxID=581036 RepID=A0A327YRX1_9BACL|nr:magnesium/cobalt transporter CorA [Anoxybacillus vitaminiphilus]RAK22475.1 magnesium transporter [Anoxybacillus vitaminiphilus]
MIRTMAFTTQHEILIDLPLEQLNDEKIVWYWVDLQEPSDMEKNVLSEFFHFHPLAIEDCFHFLQRPKLDYYEGYHFFVFHSLHKNTLETREVDVFLSKKYIVTYHDEILPEMDLAWNRVLQQKSSWKDGTIYAFYVMLDKLVDEYFPIVYQLEDELNDVDNKDKGKRLELLINQIFDIRGRLLKLRRTVFPMRDLLYRLLNSTHIEMSADQRSHFKDIYDHLLKLAEMIEANRELTSDIRDNYLSINANRTNSTMMVLTVITTIFMPLTFIAGIYGMNFEYMPELSWKYGYFAVLGFMAILGLSMYFWFRHKGWFDR